jgi:hypothetical protein
MRQWHHDLVSSQDGKTTFEDQPSTSSDILTVFALQIATHSNNTRSKQQTKESDNSK